MSYKGKYRIKNLTKYRGDFKNCIFRSLWERKFMKYCDLNSNILSWSSEEIKIPYRSPLDGKIHHYFVDFWIEAKDRNNKIKKYLIEIKPEKQTKRPILEKNEKMTRRKTEQIKTYAVNMEKWKSAKDFCEDRGWTFLILTEKHLFGKTK